MPFITPPASYNAQSKLYMQRLYNSIAQDIRNATSVPVVDSMPVNPKQGAYYFQNAINGSSVITKPGLYGYDGNQWIGNMDEQQWDNTRIESVAVNKLLAGTIGAIEIVLANSTNSIIRSANYSAGSAGWAIRGDGNAEFQNVTVRGTLNASDLIYGTIAEGRFGGDTIGAGPIKDGALHASVQSTNDSVYIAYNTAINFSSGSHTTFGPLTFAANSYRSFVILTAGYYALDNAASDGNIITRFSRNTTSAIGPTAFRNAQKTGLRSHLVSYHVDTAAGTGAANYYFQCHQSLNSSSDRAYVVFSALEFSK